MTDGAKDKSQGQAQDKPLAVLVDGYGLIFRAYHALPPSMATAAGEQTNAVFGFASMLLDVLRARRPDYAIIALEGGRTFRHDAFADYKAHRAEMPDDLRVQVSRVQELIDVLGIPVEQRESYEADDVIGSLARQLPALGVRVVVVTGDSDLLQLVADDVMVVLPGARRFGEVREFDIPAVFERYGFGPELVPDYKALVGDTSDNIPGVPGIGDKTAKALIGEFGTLEAIIDHVENVTPTRARNALKEHGEQAAKSKELATIVRDLDLAIDLDRCRVGRFDLDAVTDLFRTLEFRSLLVKLPDVLGTDGETKPARKQSEQTECVRTIVSDRAALDHLVARIEASGAIAVDVETNSTEPLRAALVGIAVATSPTESYYVPVGHQQGTQLSLDEVRAALDPVFGKEGVEIYAHHGKFDLHVLTRHGFADRPLSFDTMIAAYLLGETSMRLKDLAFTKLGLQMTEILELIGTGRAQVTMDTVPVEQAGPYACGDVEATFGLVEPLRAELEKRDQLALLNDIELPLVPVLLAMERAGVAIDKDELAAFSEELTTRIDAVVKEIHEHAGETINIGSNRQLATLLFETLGLKSGRRTKTGYSVDSDVLEALRDTHPVVGLILEYRTLAKLKSTYVDALPTQVNPDTGRVHTSYNQTIAATGRLSSINPNLQNIPIRTDVGRRVRRAFIADQRPASRLYKQATLLAADYSQMELRILAHMTEEPFLIEAFRSGDDIHRATAALVHGIDPSEVTAEMRRIAKTVNFGILYGMQSYGLARDTGMSRADATAFIENYWSRLPKVKTFFDDILRFGATHGYVRTLSGRRRYLAELLSSNGARRQGAQRMATNMPIQGTQADIVKLAMIALDKELRARKLPATMILQVHDELVLEVERAEREEVGRVVKRVMETTYELSVPVIVDLNTGDNWELMSPLTVN